MNEPRLVIEGVGNWAHTHLIGDARRITIGRSPENDIVLNGDLHASANHAEITVKDDGYYIRDLASRNGTFLGEEKIERLKLEDGAELKVGSTKVVFLLAADKAYGDTAQEPEESLDQRIADIRGPEGETGIIDFPNQDELIREVREARALIKRLKIVVEFSGMLAKKDSILTMLGAGLRFICRNLDGENGFIMQINPETKKWSVRARHGAILDWAAGALPAPDARGPQLPMSLTVVERVIKTGKPVYSLSAMDDPRFDAAKSVENLGIMGCLCAPILGKGKAVGVVYVDRRINAAPFSRSEERLFQALVDQISKILYP